MTKYVKNPDGGVHSVPDDFEVPVDWHLGNPEDAFLDEAAAREAAPTLFGERDPNVVRAEIHDGPDVVPSFNTEDGEPGSVEPVVPQEGTEAPVEEVSGGQADVQAAEEAPQV